MDEKHSDVQKVIMLRSRDDKWSMKLFESISIHSIMDRDGIDGGRIHTGYSLPG